MHKRQARLHPAGTRHLFLLLCCLIVLLAGCNESGSNGETTATGAQGGTTATSAKPDTTATALAEKQQQVLAKVKQVMQGMTLEEKLGQMIMVEFLGAQYEDTELPAMITQQHVGGFLYQKANGNFAPPLNTVDATNAFTAKAQQDAKVPLLIAIDQEGGQVNKLVDFAGKQPSAADLTATGDPNVANKQGVSTAQLMKTLGINVNLAPVVDVGPISNLLEDRQFSDDPQTVATYAGAFTDGLQQNGIIACLKHFPGLGSLSNTEDPHTVIPHVKKSEDKLESVDLLPYKTMIEKNKPAMVMTTDVFTEAFDADNPAELSHKVVTDILRKKMGYNGVIITDGIYMIERTGYMPMVQAAKQAVIAGNDIVEGPFRAQDVANVIATLKLAVQNGELSQSQVDQSVQRILEMKIQYGIIK